MTTNPDRKNGKAWKKRPKVQRKTGKTIGGYTRAKIIARAKKRGVTLDTIAWFSNTSNNHSIVCLLSSNSLRDAYHCLAR